MKKQFIAGTGIMVGGVLLLIGANNLLYFRPSQEVAVLENSSESGEVGGVSFVKIEDTNELNRIIAEVEDLQIVDVRTQAEFDQGHIEGAISVDYYNRNFNQLFSDKVDTDKPVLIYCKSGNRSRAAVEIVESLGYSEIYEFTPGYNGYIK